MADRSSAWIFGQFFQWANDPELGWPELVEKMWEFRIQFDFSDCQMECDDHLIQLGFAQLCDECGEVVVYEGDQPPCEGCRWQRFKETNG